MYSLLACNLNWEYCSLDAEGLSTQKTADLMHDKHMKSSSPMLYVFKGAKQGKHNNDQARSGKIKQDQARSSKIRQCEQGKDVFPIMETERVKNPEQNVESL